MSHFYNFNRKEISSEEIAARMDFGKVLSNYKIVTKPFYQTGWFYAATTLTIAGIAAIVFLNTGSPENENEKSAAVATKEKNISYKEDSPCIKPPQKKSDIPFYSYVIDSEKDAKIIHSTGSEIIIPSNAFSENGKPITGDVEIKYREFHDMADCVLAGIPMTYDSAGTQYHFESAGMIEIRAYQNGKPVDLDKKIAVNMSSDYTDTKYNLYHLDEENKNWVCLGKDKVNKTEIPAQKTNNDASKQLLVKEERQDELKIEIADLEKNKPVQPIKRNKSNYSFTLDVLADEFPELAAFSTERFEVSSNDKNFKPKMFDTEWEDIRLKEDPKTDELILTLTKGTQKFNFNVYPVYEGTDYTSRKEKYQSDLKLYTQKLEERIKEDERLEKEIADLRKVSVERSKEISEQWAEKNRQRGTFIPTEKDLAVYTAQPADAKVTNIRAIGGFLSVEKFKTTRSFEIGSLGVVNVDCAVTRPIAEKGKKRRFQWKNKDGISLMMQVVYVFVKKRNVMFTYMPEDFESIKMQEDGENIIVGITDKGYMAVAVPEDLKVLNWEEKVLDVEMRVFEKVKDPLEFKKIIYPNS